MLEIHPYPPFVPAGTCYLLLGSFPGSPEPGNDWYYGSRRNQLWRILELVYHLRLDTKSAKQKLFTRLQLAVTDIIYSCRRRTGTNLDSNLTDITYNFCPIQDIIAQNRLRAIFFSSRFVEKKFKKLFPRVPIPQITLPSPSPRYARLSLSAKVKVYESLLPKIDKID